MLGKVPEYYQFQNIIPRKSEIIVKKRLIWMKKDAVSKLNQKSHTIATSEQTISKIIRDIQSPVINQNEHVEKP